MIKKIFQKLSESFMIKYIEFVYSTSKVSYSGYKEFLNNENEEKLVALFWHGESYCFYPAFKGVNLYIVTTRDRRGDWISNMCRHFGYKTMRVPDTSDGGNYIFKIREIINNKDVSNIAISIDGPLGPYHIPKDFALICAYLTKRRIMPVSVNVKRKIELRKRWDKFVIPLPFNEILIKCNNPIEITHEDKNENFSSLKDEISAVMETLSISL